MAQFLDPLDIRQVGKGRWRVLAPLRYRSDLYRDTIVVPAGFLTDLASTPRWPVLYLLAGGRATGPAVTHDLLYAHDDWDDRALADRIFLEAMAVHQPELGHYAEPAWVRMLMYAGVRAGGWWAWRRHRERRRALNPQFEARGWPAVTQETS